ncbi:MAG: rhamnogalacturonan acetylesterase [Victivallaceae bacterium]|nr:rhamnogalacturonan acetylesterase [Victivallaceae bacterium]
MKSSKALCCLVGILTIAFNCYAGENLVKNPKLTMKPGSKGPTGWTNDKSAKQLVTENILATLDQAIEIKVKTVNKQHGYIYQIIKPKGGFTKSALLLQGYLKTNRKRGVFLQVKFFKGKKRLKIVNLYCPSVGNWQLVKKVIPLEGADSVHLLCRYLRSEKFLDNTVSFADISLTEVDAAEKKSDNFSTKKVKIVVLGDSTVQTYADGSVLAGWGQVIQNYFNKDVGVRNHAVSGRSTKTFIEQGRLKTALKDKANFAIIQFGHNDSHGKGRPESTDAKTDFKDYLREYIKKFNSTGATVIFVTPMCRMTFRKDGTLSDNLQPYADAMQEVAEEQQCLLIDLHSASKKLFKELGPEGCKKLQTGRKKDRTHFSPKGADAMAKLIIKELAKTNSPLVEYIKK